MKRRNWLKTMLAAATAGRAAAAPPAAPAKSIQLYCDLSVDPAKEQQMLTAFRDTFRPAAEKQPGYIDVRMLKLRSVLQGGAPAGANYRFVLIYASEELRQKWISSPTHQKVWPLIENTLRDKKNYPIELFDDVTFKA